MKIDEGLVLFDTCDFWISSEVSAAKVNKKLDNVVRVGDSVFIHGCLIDKSQKVAYLATSVWLRSNAMMAKKVPLAISRNQIHNDKIDIYQKVVVSIANSIESFTQSRENNFMSKHVIMWEHAVVKAVFFDNEWKSNGNLVAGIVQTKMGYGFFLSKVFANINSIPNIGMEEYANLFPVRELHESFRCGPFTFICTNLYSVAMDKRTCTIPKAEDLKDILDETTEFIERLLIQYPDLQNIGHFLR